MPQATEVNVISDSEIQVVTPAGAAGVVDVTVTNPDGGTYTFPAAFTFVTAPVQPPLGGQGLLSGMTPANLTVPSGWTFVASQDFESGGVGGNESIVGTITGSFGHNSSHSLFGQYAGDAQGYAWFLNPNVVNSRDVYVSWYEYNDSQMRFNDEMFIARFFLADQSQELVLDWYGQTAHTGAACDATAFNALNAEIVFIGQASSNQNSRVFGGCGSPTRGVWDQWEVHFRANDPNVSNGILQVYKNGSIFLQSMNQRFNYGVDMRPQQIEIGGVYTKLVWGKTTNGVCDGRPASWAGDGLDNCFRAREHDFNIPCYFPSECPPGGFVPIFKRYWDDIVVIKR